MPLDTVAFLGSRLLAGRHLTRYVVAIIVVATIRAYCQGRTTTRERDLHARTILLTVRRAFFYSNTELTLLIYLP